MLVAVTPSSRKYLDMSVFPSLAAFLTALSISGRLLGAQNFVIPSLWSMLMATYSMDLSALVTLVTLGLIAVSACKMRVGHHCSTPHCLPLTRCVDTPSSSRCVDRTVLSKSQPLSTTVAMPTGACLKLPFLDHRHNLTAEVLPYLLSSRAHILQATMLQQV